MDRDELYTRLGALEEGQRRMSLQLAAIAHDVASLVAARSYIRGVWAAVVLTATVVSAFASALITWLNGRH